MEAAELPVKATTFAGGSAFVFFRAFRHNQEGPNMAVSFHKRDELYAERANLKGQLDALLPKMHDGDPSALESFTALEGKISSLTDSIREAEAGIKADQDAREASLAHREALGRAEKLSRELGAADPRAKAAHEVANQIARDNPQASDRTASASKDYEAAFRQMLAFGYGGLMPEERAALGGASSFSKDELQSLRESDPEFFAIIHSGDDVSAGYLVPAEPMRQIVMTQSSYSGMLQAPTFKFSTSTGRDIPIPTLNDTNNSGAWISDLGDHSGATDPQFGVKVMGAHMLSTKIVRVARAFLTDSGYPFETILYGIFGERNGRAKNTAFTTGNGVGKPTGIAASATSGVTGASASAITFNELTDLEHSVNPAYRANRAAVGYQAADSTIKSMKKLLDGDGRPLWQVAVASGQPDTINGWRYWVNDDVAAMGASAKSVFFGDWSKYHIRTAGGATIRRLEERYAELNQVGFVLIERVDGLLTDTAAIKYLANA